MISLKSQIAAGLVSAPGFGITPHNSRCRRTLMKTMLLTASLSLVASTAAYADSGEGPAANTSPSAGVAAQAGHGGYAYVTQSNRSTSVFAPNDNQGANS